MIFNFRQESPWPRRSFSHVVYTKSWAPPFRRILSLHWRVLLVNFLYSILFAINRNGFILVSLILFLWTSEFESMLTSIHVLQPLLPPDVVSLCVWRCAVCYEECRWADLPTHFLAFLIYFHVLLWITAHFFALSTCFFFSFGHVQKWFLFLCLRRVW